MHSRKNINDITHRDPSNLCLVVAQIANETKCAFSSEQLTQHKHIVWNAGVGERERERAKENWKS